MRKAENTNAPNLSGWIIGLAAGLVCLGALVVVGKFDLFPAAAVGGVVALIAGAVLGLPWGSGPVGPVRTADADTAPVRVGGQAAVAEAAPLGFVSAPAAKPAPAAKAKPVAAAKPKVAAKPKAAPATKAAAVAEVPAAKAAAKPKAAAKQKVAKPAGPERLKAARKGRADDLKEIEGIGPAMEKLVNSMGFYHFDQLASWSEADVALVDAEMKTFKGRITRDKWVAQARIIVTEGLEAFRERAKTNNY
jgi:predicted flap endonuclease-1-like 5' DNA nuclease